jgi:tetratricopeptide (TPR) repeat protein
MRWVDDAPLPEPLPQKVLQEMQGRIAWLYEKEKDDADEAGHALAVEALKVVPDNVELLNAAALCYCYRDQWAEAKPYLERAEKADPEDLVVKLNLGRMYSNLGDKRLARAKYQEVIKLAPGTDDARKAQKAIDELGAKKKK